MENQLYPVKLYLQTRPNKIMIATSLIFNLLIWGWLFWYISPQEDPIFLHYNILFGVDLIGPWWKIYTMPATGFFILLANAIMGWFSFHRDKYLAYFLNFTSIICQILLFVSTYLIVFLNI